VKAQLHAAQATAGLACSGPPAGSILPLLQGEVYATRLHLSALAGMLPEKPLTGSTPLALPNVAYS